MEFEYNESKSRSNKEKHGIDFRDAEKLWSDSDCIIIPARTAGESRFLLIGKLEEKIWSAIFTIRENKIRIISVRRARNNEEKYYKD